MYRPGRAAVLATVLFSSLTACIRETDTRSSVADEGPPQSTADERTATTPPVPESVDSFDGYYAGIVATDRMTLRRQLHELIDDHTRVSYSMVWTVLEMADEDPANPSHVLDLYRNASIAKFGGGNGPYNREHTWPKSYGFPNDSASNYPFTDCHHLFLCDVGYNSSRGNNPYDDCAGCEEKPTVSTGGAGGGTENYPGNSNWRRGSNQTGRWETWIGRRGDVARAQFYLDVRYEGGTHGGAGTSEPDLVLTDDLSQLQTGAAGVAFMGRRSTLLRWHREDPVDDKERHRNDVIQQHQGNRNPFIDHPEWVDCVFEDNCN